MFFYQLERKKRIICRILQNLVAILKENWWTMADNKYELVIIVHYTQLYIVTCRGYVSLHWNVFLAFVPIVHHLILIKSAQFQVVSLISMIHTRWTKQIYIFMLHWLDFIVIKFSYLNLPRCRYYGRMYLLISEKIKKIINEWMQRN